MKSETPIGSDALLCPFCGKAVPPPVYEGSSDWVFECENLPECGARMGFFVSNRTDEGSSDAGALKRFIRRQNMKLITLISAFSFSAFQLLPADSYTTVPYGTGTLTRGPNGQVWTTRPTGNGGTLTRGPGGKTYATIPYGTGTLTRGPNGQVWTTRPTGPSSAVLITPGATTGRGVATTPAIRFTPNPRGITRQPGPTSLQGATGLHSATSLRK
jgi:hypothetical protein